MDAQKLKQQENKFKRLRDKFLNRLEYLDYLRDQNFKNLDNATS